jgi:hypothetical protein
MTAKASKSSPPKPAKPAIAPADVDGSNDQYVCSEPSCDYRGKRFTFRFYEPATWTCPICTERAVQSTEYSSCQLCETPTRNTGTKLCDSCWELDHRVRAFPEIARKILATINK